MTNNANLENAKTADSANFDDIYERVKKTISGIFKIEENDISENAKFVEDLGADSLDVVELVMALEQEFGKEITDEEAQKIQKVSDAVKFIAKQK